MFTSTNVGLGAGPPARLKFLAAAVSPLTESIAASSLVSAAVTSVLALGGTALCAASRNADACWYPSHDTCSPFMIFICSACCAVSPAAVTTDLGSGFTVSGCVYDRPSTVRRNVYVPGTTNGPSGDGGVSPGFAASSYVCANTGGASYRRSQLTRF